LNKKEDITETQLIKIRKLETLRQMELYGISKEQQPKASKVPE
jgi:hypothetical protein